MRISDWSSDVCSSYLGGPLAHAHEAVRVEAPGLAHREADAVVGDLEGPLLAVAAPGDRDLAGRGMALDVGHRLLGDAPQLTLLEDRQAPGLLGPEPDLEPEIGRAHV